VVTGNFDDLKPLPNRKPVTQFIEVILVTWNRLPLILKTPKPVTGTEKFSGNLNYRERFQALIWIIILFLVFIVLPTYIEFCKMC